VAPQLADLLGPLLHARAFTAVPPSGAGACDVCHGPAPPGKERCAACRTVIAQVDHPLTLVVPISLYTTASGRLPGGGQLANLLWEYKDRRKPIPEVPWQVAALLARFLAAHHRCLERQAGGGWELVATVPSTVGRNGQHPLRTALHRMSRFDQPREEREVPLLRPGPAPLRESRADPDGFTVTEAVAGRRVLLVDDALVTGARLQSAAAALRAAGAVVVAGVVVGRLVLPRGATVERFWRRQRAREFSFDACCLEDSQPFQPTFDLDAVGVP
jgi:Phosphoribosyl transferase domain